MSRHLFAELMAGIVLLTIVPVSGQVIAISGTVTNSAGAKVPGAAIHLVKQNLDTKSAADGTYALLRTIAATLDQAADRSVFDFTVSNGALLLTIPRDHYPVSATLYDCSGSVVSRIVHGTLPVGNHELAIVNRRTAGILILRIVADRVVYAGPTLCLNGLTGAAVSTNRDGLHGRLARPGQVAAAVDTLVATHASYSATRVVLTAWSGVVNIRMSDLDPYAKARQACVDRVNAFRATIGMGPLIRYTAKEACVDSQAMHDATVNKAHDYFGKCGESAQNECPGWSSADQIVSGCMQSMWDEGPGTPYSAHGHYINMTNPAYTRIAVGFYAKSQTVVWGIQDFY
jgi:hypothetical protein